MVLWSVERSNAKAARSSRHVVVAIYLLRCRGVERGLHVDFLFWTLKELNGSCPQRAQTQTTSSPPPTPMADPNPLRPLDLLLEAAAIQILAPVPAILTPSTSSTSSGGYSDPPPSPLDPPVRKRKWLDVVLNDSNVNVDPLVVFGPGVAWFSDAASARLPTPLVPAPAPAPVPTARNRQFTWVAVTPTSGNVSTPSDTAPAAAAPFRPAARAIAAASSVVAKARTAYPSPPTQHITTPMAPPALALPAQELGQLTEAQTRKVVEHLAVVLSEAKKDVLERLQQMDDGLSLDCSEFLGIAEDMV